MLVRRTRFAFVVLLLSLAASSAHAQGKSPSSEGCQPLQFGFPASNPIKHTSWELCFQAVSGKMFDRPSRHAEDTPW